MLRACVAAVIFLAAQVSVAGEILFQDGRTEWKIFLSPQASPMETFAAEELRDALRKISGAAFEIVSAGEVPERRAIVIGDLKHPEIGRLAGQLGLKPGKVEELAVYTLGGRLCLAGNQPRGALYAVYHFLQHELGVRWLWPGADGEFMPARKSWELPELKFNHRPAIAYRGFHLCGDWRDVEIFREWMGRNFINIHRHAAGPQEQRRGFYSMWSSHNVNLPEKLFEQHPEYFAEIKGKRYRSNICFSNPEVDRLVAADSAAYVKKRPFLEILSVFPEDNQDYCRCAKCSMMDVSTAWFEFYNRLTDALRKEFPDLKFATIAYQGYRDVPKCAVRNSEFIEYASHGRCNIHPYGTAGCPRNEETMHVMLNWKATGLPIGHYAYEYDVYMKNARFFPMLSMIEDAVKTSRKLGHVAVIPEVVLSPKSGPDVYAHHVQNRLSIYLYARLLWDPDQPMSGLLRDWCQTAYADAADPMREYLTVMDRAWTGMPIHATILGNALGAAPHLLTEPVRGKATQCFAAAQDRLAKMADAGARERAQAAVMRERALFNQWQELLRLNSDAPRLSLPLLAQAGDFPQTASRPCEIGPASAGDKAASTRVSLAWTKDALFVRWACADPAAARIKADATAHDGKVVEDDSVELLLSSGLTGETWHLAVNAKSIRQDWRISSVGVREDRWSPAWEAAARVREEAWEATMVIPFASLGQVPNANETWQARFVRRGGGRADVAEQVFPAGEPALLAFSAAARTDRAILWWAGEPAREGPRDGALTQEFSQAGWQLHIASTPEKLLAAHGQADAYWFRHPHGSSKVPADYWKNHLAPAVKAGALAVFISYRDMPLDQYFNDPALKVNVASCGPIPLAERVTAFIAPGDWCRKPHDLQRALTGNITPAYGVIPANPAGWTVLATAPAGNNTTFPYLLARRYGKGMIIVGGDDIRVPPARMLENFIQYHQQAK